MKPFTVKAWSPTARQMIVLKLIAEDADKAKASAKEMGLKLIVVQDGDTAEAPGGEPHGPTDAD